MPLNAGSLATLALAAASIVGSAVGHIILAHPIPFTSNLDNSPLIDGKEPGAPGSNYPCKQPMGGSSNYQYTMMNTLSAGKPHTLDFIDSASHFGGTCELGITLDLEPTANSTFKLFQVYEGGCPTRSDAGGTDKFSYEIPKDFPNGPATFAWVWFNRVGNREIYMNCAPITVTGGSDTKDYFETLPNLYLPNLPSQDCKSADSMDVTVPFPGQFVIKDDVFKPADATGSKCAALAAAMTQGVSGYKSDIVSNFASHAAASSDDAIYAPVTAAAGSASGSAGVASVTMPGAYNGVGASVSITATTTATMAMDPPAADSSPIVISTAPQAPSSPDAASSIATAAPPASGTPDAASSFDPSVYTTSAATPAASPSAPISAPIVISTAAPTPSATGEVSSFDPAVYASPAAGASGSSSSSASSSYVALSASASATESSSPASPMASSSDSISTISFSTMSIGTDSAISPSATSPSAASPSATQQSATSPSATSTDASSATGSNSTGSSAGDACTRDGAVICNGASQFGLCNFGKVVWQSVAAGTTCNNGVISKRADVRQVRVRRAQQNKEQSAE